MTRCLVLFGSVGHTVAMADTVIDPPQTIDTVPDLADVDTGDHDRFAHYVFGKDASSRVTEAMVLGTPIEALCGKKWVPSRDASRFPVCPECKAIKSKIQGG